MTKIDKSKPAPVRAKSDPEPAIGPDTEPGRALLRQLGPSLASRGVPPTSYVMVNLANGEFVTGKTRAETAQRFASLHPGAEGLMQLVGDVIGVSLGEAAATTGDAESEDDAPPARAAPRNVSSPRWNGRRGPTRS